MTAPRFHHEPITEGQMPPMRNCAACDELAYVDRETGLCRPCWRAWRFSYPSVVWDQLADAEALASKPPRHRTCCYDECCTDAVIQDSVEKELQEKP